MRLARRRGNMFLAADVPHLASLSASLFISGESRLYRGAVTCPLLIVAFSYRSVKPCNGALPRKSRILHSFISANSSAELQHCHREAAEFSTSHLSSLRSAARFAPPPLCSR